MGRGSGLWEGISGEFSVPLQLLPVAECKGRAGSFLHLPCLVTSSCLTTVPAPGGSNHNSDDHTGMLLPAGHCLSVLHHDTRSVLSGKERIWAFWGVPPAAGKYLVTHTPYSCCGFTKILLTKRISGIEGTIKARKCAFFSIN